MSDLAIEIKGLRKAYPVPGDLWLGFVPRLGGERVEALRGVDLQVRAGEIFGLLGPNGAGKSTLLRVLATLVLPEEGSVRVGGVDVLAEEERVRDRIGVMLEHERSFFGRLSGRHNLSFFADLQQVPRPVAVRRIEELLETVELTGAAERRVQTYSLGMHHRLALARALLTDPEVLLLDEPTRSLDPEAKRRMSELLREGLAGSGKSILLLTHDLEVASSICDRIGFLVEGEIRDVGRPAGLVRRHGAADLQEVYRTVVQR